MTIPVFPQNKPIMDAHFLSSLDFWLSDLHLFQSTQSWPIVAISQPGTGSSSLTEVARVPNKCFLMGSTQETAPNHVTGEVYNGPLKELSVSDCNL